jgi:hypothetical protein
MRFAKDPDHPAEIYGVLEVNSVIAAATTATAGRIAART